MGRATAIPASDTSVGGSGTVTLSYFANDMVHSENDGTRTDTFALDPASRLLSTTDSSTGATTTKVYAGPGDSPAWLSSSTGSWSRNVTDIAGNLAAIQTGTTAGTATIQIVNPHGDVVATLTDPSSGVGAITAYFETTEFGAPRPANTAKAANYGWLGGARRDSGDLAGLVMMGRRLYDPFTGRFTSVDPVAGGSANDYDYCSQDPINRFDPMGTQILAAGGGGGGGNHKKDSPKRSKPTKTVNRPSPTIAKRTHAAQATKPNPSSRQGGGGGHGRERAQDAAGGWIAGVGVGLGLLACPECEVGLWGGAALEVAAHGIGTVLAHQLFGTTESSHRPSLEYLPQVSGGYRKLWL
jgi:RHS repeat-associated protein